MIRAIVFDFDGIIVDSEPLHYKAFLRIMQQQFDVSFTYDDYLAKYVGFDDRDGFDAISKDAGVATMLDAPTRQKMIADKAVAFEAIAAEGVTPIPGVLDFIPQAKAAMPVAIASGACRSDIDVILRQLGHMKTFPIIVSADDVKRSKPDPETYRKAVAALGESLPDLQPSECVAIEDMRGGIESARTAGLHVLGMMTTNSDPQALHQTHRVVDNFVGLTVEQLQAWFG